MQTLLPVRTTKVGSDVTHLQVNVYYQPDSQSRGYWLTVHPATKTGSGMILTHITEGRRARLEQVKRGSAQRMTNWREQVRRELAERSGAAWDLVQMVAASQGLELIEEVSASA